MTRRLNKEDRTLWRIVSESVARLHPRAPEEFEEMMADAAPKQATAKPVVAPASSRIVQPKTPQPRGQEVDARTMARFRRGQMPIESRLDLHGHRLHEAYDAVRGFVALSHEQGRRCVLVIHGKGLMTGESKIKGKLPQWLAERPDIVLAWAGAKPEHGGAGASYVLLRRQRT